MPTVAPAPARENGATTGRSTTPAAPAPERAPAAAPVAPEAGGPEPTRGPPGGARGAGAEAETDVAGTAFELLLGSAVERIPLVGEHVRVTRNAYEVDLTRLGLALPGVALERLTLRRGADGIPTDGTLRGSISAPFVSGRAELTVDAGGNLSGGAQARFDVEVLGRPLVSFNYSDRQWSGSVTLEGPALRLPIPGVTIEGGRATISFAGDQLTGSLEASFRHAALGTGRVIAAMTNEGISGGGELRLTVPMLQGSTGRVAIENGRLSAHADLTASAIQVPIPGLSITAASGSVDLREGAVSGTAALSAAYAGLATLELSGVSFTNRGIRGAAGTIAVTAPPLQGSSGTFRLDEQGRPSGRLVIASDRIPIPALRRGQLTLTLRPDGGVDVAGSGRVELGAIGGGDFTASYADGVLSLGGDVMVRVPGLEPVQGRFQYADGQLRGEVSTGVTVGPLSGTVLLRYADGALSGQGRLAYALGRFQGWVDLAVGPEGEISGSGEATFRLTDWLTGTIGLVLHPDLNVDARGELVVADVTLFEPWKFERNFFSFEQEFPLWGITIPVVGSIGIIAEIHASAGFRASFGPGLFRNIRAAGEISTRPDQEPAFSLSGELFIPAGAEIVLTLGGGIGLAALVAKISGGLDIVGIAGIYGAISITPTFAYRDGQYSLKGVALLQAAAQLRAALNAYARIKVGIGWFSKEVWRRDWNLAEMVFDTGWAIGLQAGIEYVLGQPFVPKLDFQEVAIDPKALIKAAVPDSGQPVPAPPKPATPAAQFTPTEGEAPPAQAQPVAPADAAAAPGVAGPAAPPAAAGEAPGPAAPVPEGSATPPPAGAPVAGEAAPQAEVDPPAAESEEPEERDIEEAYLVYVYESLEPFLQKAREDTALPEERLAEEARRDMAEGAPPPTMPGDRRSPGRPLPPGIRSGMEAAFERDLSTVRVHTDDEAAESARQIGAKAYAVGEDIYFGPSHDEASDEELLAHELTHVAQGTAGTATGIGPPGDENEREAEETARAVVRGEPAGPVPQRSDGALVRRAEDEGKGDPPKPKVPFTLDQWNKIRQDPGMKGSGLQAAIDKLDARETVQKKAAQNVYDEKDKGWRARAFVPMRYPAANALSHYSALANAKPQIEQSDFLVREYGREDDSAQSEMRKLMYPAGTTNVSPEGFTKHVGGFVELPKFEDAWQAYQEQRTRKRDFEHEPLEGVKNQKTTASEAHLNLSFQAFKVMWETFIYWPQHGEWRIRPEKQAGAAAPGADTAAAATDEDTRAVLVADFQAHHVIPLWLRSEDAKRPDGDQIPNLVPWHQSAHQTNHNFHHGIPDEIQKLVGLRDYRDFEKGTRFWLVNLEGGKGHPTPVPAVQLVEDSTAKDGWRWEATKTGNPVWLK